MKHWLALTVPMALLWAVNRERTDASALGHARFQRLGERIQGDLDHRHEPMLPVFSNGVDDAARALEGLSLRTDKRPERRLALDVGDSQGARAANSSGRPRLVRHLRGPLQRRERLRRLGQAEHRRRPAGARQLRPRLLRQLPGHVLQGGGTQGRRDAPDRCANRRHHLGLRSRVRQADSALGCWRLRASRRTGRIRPSAP